MITVGQLEKILKGIKDKSRVVILQGDAEGNSYSPLAAVDDNFKYHPENSYSGEVSVEKMTPELEERGFGADDMRAGGKKAVVFAPVN